MTFRRSSVSSIRSVIVSSSFLTDSTVVENVAISCSFPALVRSTASRTA